MNKIKHILFYIMLFVLSFIPVSSYAYVKVETGPVTNSFSLGEYTPCIVTRRYYYVDENNNRQIAKASTTETHYCGQTITLNQGLMSLDYSSVDYYVGGNIYNQPTYVINNDITIDEVYNLNRYTITYNLDGGTLNNRVTTYTSMTPTFSLGTPTRNNYTFGGWCVNNNCTDPYTINQGSTGNISVTASWHQNYTVTYSGSNYSHDPSGNNVTTYDTAEFVTTIDLTTGYSLNSITVKMGGVTLTEGTDYSQVESSGDYVITIFNVTGNIEINVSASFECLAEGTLVMLWDGSTKRIEDIKYNDLLKVWNHDLGRYGYEYAGWIEKVGTINEYTKVTFSDGNELKVIGNHSIFSKTKNKYVDINSDEFNVGDEVVNLRNGISYVSVTNIEHIEEDINYYHVISTRYFNLITNDILTTYEIYNNVSNFMDFGDNLKWQNTEIVRSDMYTYDDFLYLDKYIYKVFRLEETKYLVNTGLVTVDQFNNLFTNYLMNNDKKVIPPQNENGDYLWMVVTSDDIDPSDTIHQLVEGSTYVVPEPTDTNNFLYWYNHSDNKTYSPGDTLEVDSSMYLEAIYE